MSYFQTEELKDGLTSTETVTTSMGLNGQGRKPMPLGLEPGMWLVVRQGGEALLNIESQTGQGGISTSQESFVLYVGAEWRDEDGLYAPAGPVWLSVETDGPWSVTFTRAADQDSPRR